MAASIRAAAVANGIVVNVEMIEPGFEREGVIYVPTDTAGIGWLYDGKTFKAPPVVEPEPADPYAHYVPISLLRQRLEKLGLFDDFSAYLAQFPTLMFKVLSLERGVDPAYPDLITAFDAMSVPQSIRDYLMADPAMGIPDIPTE